jgi:antitoxin (DNA-binding transcriptional repressor) of toxin-antitoxin stability system
MNCAAQAGCSSRLTDIGLLTKPSALCYNLMNLIVMGCVMRIIPADEFGANWPRLLSELSDGEEFLLTDDGRPVGRVLPPKQGNLKQGDEDYDSRSSDNHLRAFQELTTLVRSRADRYPPGHIIDDSRESIYRDREALPR